MSLQGRRGWGEGIEDSSVVQERGSGSRRTSSGGLCVVLTVVTGSLSAYKWI